MTFTVIEYTEVDSVKVETCKTEVPDYAAVGLFIMQRVEELNLIPEDEVYRNPDGQVVHYALDHESGLRLLRRILGEVQ